MTQEFSFKHYLSNYDNLEICNFKDYFKEKINSLPNKTISSKEIFKLLNISDNFEKKIFQDAFFEYFKEKIKNNY
jgi:hypothetical protein